MKKSMLSVITLALVVINLILSTVIVFSVLPASRKTDKMITQVCSALDLELESQKEAEGKRDYSIDQIETFDIEDSLTIPLKKGQDGKDHYAVVAVSIVVDKKHDDYKKYVESITSKESLIKDAINSVISGFSINEMESGQSQVQEAVLLKIQDLFDSEFIVKVAFRDMVFQ